MKHKRNGYRRLPSLMLAAIMLCTACGQPDRTTPRHPAETEGGVEVDDDEGKAVQPTERPENAQDDGLQDVLQELERQEEEERLAQEADRQRRAALLSALNALSTEEAMYAGLGDLNGDGLDDVLILGKHTGVVGNQCYSGLIWDGTGVQQIPFDQSEYLRGFGIGEYYEVYREKETGMLYVLYSLSQDGVYYEGYENATGVVEYGFGVDYEAPGAGENRQREMEKLRAQVEERFELAEKIDYADEQYGDWAGTYWGFYFDGIWERPQELPRCRATVDEVRRLLSEDGQESLTEGNAETGPEEMAQEAAGAEGRLPAGVDSMTFSFSSGAGGWGTGLVLHADGSFEGSYHDSNMGESGEGYLATCYVCSFEGRFADIRKVNDHTWSMRLESMTLEEEPGKEWIDEEVRYVASEPYGMENGKEFILFTPDAPVEEMPEDFLSWRMTGQNTSGLLGSYGIYNRSEGYGFFNY